MVCVLSIYHEQRGLTGARATRGQTDGAKVLVYKHSQIAAFLCSVVWSVLQKHIEDLLQRDCRLLMKELPQAHYLLVPRLEI
jgi:hypothetical protein